MADGPIPQQSSGAAVGGVAPGPSLREIAVLIPAWQPTTLLFALARDLLSRGFGVLLIVDDGSAAAAQPVFEALAALPRVEVLRHTVNRGKGRALKAGFDHLRRHQPWLAGVVTADADGQHTAEDIGRVAEVLLRERTRPVLGVRRFDGDVPLRSRLGNGLSRQAFGMLTGVRLRDTQTGLRGLPLAILPELLALEGERYDYELTTLAHLCRSGQVPSQVPIATIYLEGNRGSHFSPVRDSLRVLLALARLCRSVFHKESSV